MSRLTKRNYCGEAELIPDKKTPAFKLWDNAVEKLCQYEEEEYAEYPYKSVRAPLPEGPQNDQVGEPGACRLCGRTDGWHDFEKELPPFYHESYLVWVKTEEGEKYLDVDAWNEHNIDGETEGFWECYNLCDVLYWRETPEEPV